ncbi:hypothetical protein G6F31_015517 [Rhizopus arrhizus]|nr:hypothetical protein G6F31_015517 [Rhizopus arrhizus]
MVEVVRDQRLQPRVATTGGAALGAHDVGQRLAALDLGPAGAAQRAAVAAAQRQRFAQVQLQVDVGQHVVVLATATDEAAVGRVDDVQLVGRAPADAGGYAHHRVGFYFGALVAHAGGHVQRHRPVEAGAVLQVGAAAAGAGRIGGAADLCGAIDQAVEVEDQELAGQARIAVAGERLEVLGHVVRIPDVIGVVGRCSQATPGIALHDRRRRTVLHLGVADAEVQRRILFWNTEPVTSASDACTPPGGSAMLMIGRSPL